jgi:hypothetical protein
LWSENGAIIPFFFDFGENKTWYPDLAIKYYEFQYITQYIYRDEKCEGKPDDTLAGSYHSLSESKIAPMLVPYLTEDEGLQAVYKYAEFYDEPITNDTALQINELCLADPFFISCVIISDYDEKDLTTSDGVINTVNYEICFDTAEMFLNWAEYIDETVSQVNDKNAKNILLFLSKNNDSYFTPKELKEKLALDLEVNKIHKHT